MKCHRKTFMALVWVISALGMAGCVSVSKYRGGQKLCVGQVQPLGDYVGSGPKTNGSCRCYWPGGELKYSGNYVYGRPVGRHQVFSPDGVTIDDWVYLKPEKGIIGLGDPTDGNHMGYWPNGVTRVSESLVDGKVEGQRVVWDEHGKTIGKCMYLGGVPRDGVAIEFYSWSAERFGIAMITEYLKGKKSGAEWHDFGGERYLVWYADGVPLSRADKNSVSVTFPDLLGQGITLVPNGNQTFRVQVSFNKKIQVNQVFQVGASLLDGEYYLRTVDGYGLVAKEKLKKLMLRQAPPGP